MAREQVQVEVLGPLRVRGLTEPFRRAAARELIVFLAFHRGGVTQGECALALWPDRVVAASTMHSTSSDARRAVGPARLPRSGALLELTDSVTTDVDRFAALASADDPDLAVRAMGLLRGAPFGGLRHADWAVFDGTQANIEELVVQTAVLAADRLLEQTRAADAEWVVRKALLVSPFDERLYRGLLRATHAHGDRVRLHCTMAQLVRMAEVAEAPWTTGRSPRDTAAQALHPETAALYRDLLVSTPAPGAQPTRQ